MLLAVTGATGFLGRHLIPAAQRAGHQVRALARSSEVLPPGVENVTGDLEDRQALVRLLDGADVAVHLAALGVQSRDRDWDGAARVNVLGSLALLEAAAKAGVGQVVAAGTCLEYAGFGRLPEAPWTGTGPYPLCDESSPLETSDAYGATKAAGGIVMRARARELGLPFWYLRLASIYGPGDDPDKLLPSAIRAAKEGRRFDMTAGEQVREWLHVEDGVTALLAAAGRAAPAGAPIVNVGTGEGLRLREAVERAVVAAGGKPELVARGVRPYRKGEVQILVMDVTRSRERFASPTPRGIEHGLRELVRTE